MLGKRGKLLERIMRARRLLQGFVRTEKKAIWIKDDFLMAI